MSADNGISKASDPDWSKRYRETKNVPWYLASIDHKVTPQTRDLLEKYSKVPAGDVLQHVRDIRDKAWAIRSYPCTGLGNFLDPMIPKCPAYGIIIKRLQSGDSLLDVGCFLGQDLRRLVFDGAPSECLYGLDIVSHWDVGYDMFRDRGQFAAHFMEGDILHPNEALQGLHSSIDIISITHVFHQWGWGDQVAAAKQLSALLRPGGMVVGFQVGTVGENLIKAAGLAKSDCYWHNPGTFQRMWSQVSEDTGMVWVSEAQLKTWEEIGWNPQETAYLGKDARIIQFVVNRTQ
ncbi:hypothetical protein MMC26_007293 [Xylographa opegraphella]|nr:hypothetical protein [Xylographa opegraphella]